MMKNKLFQIIDANLNRTREGLRVCEDITRFVILDKGLARSLKSIRHGATRALVDSKMSFRDLLETRDTKKDALKFIDFKKKKATDLSDIFMSNIERVKESLRVLEECSKIVDKTTSRKYRRLRFNAYDVEQRVIKKIRSISCPR